MKHASLALPAVPSDVFRDSYRGLMDILVPLVRFPPTNIPSADVNIAIENGRRNSEFSH